MTGLSSDFGTPLFIIPWDEFVSTEPVDLSNFEELFSSSLRGLTPETKRKYLVTASTFARFVQARGADLFEEVTPQLVEDFVGSFTIRHNEYRDPSASTMANRRAVLRRLGRTLADFGVETAPLLLQPGARKPQATAARPATPLEIARIKESANSGSLDTRGPAIVGLALAGARPVDMAGLRHEDVNLTHGTVFFRTDGRVNNLTDWGLDVIAARIGHPATTQSGLVVIEGPKVLPHVATASISGQLRSILRTAGLTDEAIKPSSVRAGQARLLYEESNDLPKVARWLGTGLDTAARTIALEWRNP